MTTCPLHITSSSPCPHCAAHRADETARREALIAAMPRRIVSGKGARARAYADVKRNAVRALVRERGRVFSGDVTALLGCEASTALGILTKLETAGELVSTFVPAGRGKGQRWFQARPKLARLSKQPGHEAGPEHFNARLTETVVLDVRRRVDAGESRSDVGRDIGISRQCVGQIAARKLWRHVP